MLIKLKNEVLLCLNFILLQKIDIFKLTVQKYRFNRLLTKDPSEVTSLEYK